MISVKATADAGTRFAGFQITEFPKASAGAIFHAAVAVGAGVQQRRQPGAERAAEGCLSDAGGLCQE